MGCRVCELEGGEEVVIFVAEYFEEVVVGRKFDPESDKGGKLGVRPNDIVVISAVSYRFRLFSRICIFISLAFAFGGSSVGVEFHFVLGSWCAGHVEY